MHPTFNVPAGIIPKPANGYTYGPADGNASASTWARADMYARIAVFAAQGKSQASFAANFKAKVLDASPLDQVDGLQHLETFTQDQSDALAKGTANTRFINVSSKGNEQPMPALNSGGSPVTGAQAWQGPNAHGVENVNLDNLPDAYAHAFQHSINVGDN